MAFLNISVLKKLHRWAGLALFIILSLLCLTGSLLLFEDELEPFLLGLNVKPQAVGGPVWPRLDELAQRAVSQPGSEQVTRIYPSMSPNSPTRIRAKSLLGPDSEIERFINPANGQVLSERQYKEIGLSRASLMPTVKALHTKLLAGDIGEIILGVVAILWLLSGAAGVILSMPRGRLRSKWPHGWRIKRLGSSYQLHRGGGLWLSGAVIIFSVSAIVLVFEDGLFTDAKVAPATQATNPIGFDAAAIVAHSQLPANGRDYRLASIRIESDKSRYRVDFSHEPAHGIWHRPQEQVYVDASNGQLLGRAGWLAETGVNTIKNLALPLHTGEVLGWPGRIAALIAAILLVIQIIAGVWFWSRQRARHARKQQVA